MKQIETPEAFVIEFKLEERTGEMVSIFYGQPDARTMNGYHAYLRTHKGMQAVGTYGELYRSSKTLQGLLD